MAEIEGPSESYKTESYKEEVKFHFSREELLEISKQALGDLISSDPLLEDLPNDVTLEEVTAQLALQHGQSMNVYIHKNNGDEYRIVVPVKATVLDLKKAIKRHVNLLSKRTGSKTNISWRYVWRMNVLVSGSIKLEDDNEKLSNLGIVNKSVLRFEKKLRPKSVIKKRSVLH